MKTISRIYLPAIDPILKIESVQFPLSRHSEIRLYSIETKIQLHFNDIETLAVIQHLASESALPANKDMGDIKIDQGVKTIEIPRKHAQFAIYALFRVLIDLIHNPTIYVN